MEQHIYTSSNGTFIPWHLWVYSHGTEEDIALHDSTTATAHEKKDLYERWLEDQKIVTYTKKVDGVITQEEEWYWD